MPLVVRDVSGDVFAGNKLDGVGNFIDRLGFGTGMILGGKVVDALFGVGLVASKTLLVCAATFEETKTTILTMRGFPIAGERANLCIIFP